MAKRYKGNKATVDAYKRELKNFKARVKSLEAKGVTVDIKKKLPKPGEHVAPKDVRWLQSQTTEKIAQKSYIEVQHEVYIHGRGKLPPGMPRNARATSWATIIVQTEIIKGRDVVRTLKKRAVRSAREKREARSPFYRDRETGMMVNKETGEVLTNKEYKDYKRGLKEGHEPAPSYQNMEDFSSEYLGQWLNNLGGFMSDDDTDFSNLPNYVIATDKQARQIESYVVEALREYGTEGVVRALQGMSMDGYEISVKTLYDKDAFDSYWNELINRLPVDGRFDMDMMHNDE